MQDDYSQTLFDASVRPLLEIQIDPSLDARLQTELKQLDQLFRELRAFKIDSICEPAILFRAGYGSGDTDE